LINEKMNLSKFGTMYKVWNEILEFLNLGFTICEFTESEYNSAPDRYIQGFETGIGFLNGKETTNLQAFYRRTLKAYKDELNNLLLIDVNDRIKVLNIRNTEIGTIKASLPDFDAYKKEHPYTVKGNQQVADYKERIGMIPGKLIPIYEPKFNFTRVTALKNLYSFIDDIEELNNNFLSDYGSGMKHNNISFNYARNSSTNIDRLYDNLCIYKYINGKECSKIKFRKMFWKGFKDEKINWRKSQASFKYFIKSIFWKKQILGLSHKGKGKWIIAAHYFTVGGNEKDEETMSSFDNKVSKKDKENLDLILQVFE